MACGSCWRGPGSFRGGRARKDGTPRLQSPSYSNVRTVRRARPKTERETPHRVRFLTPPEGLPTPGQALSLSRSLMYAGFSSCPLFVGPGLPSPVLPDRPDLVSHGGRAGAHGHPSEEDLFCDVGHRQRVGPLVVAEGADRYEVDGERLIRREGHPGVVAHAAPVVWGAGNLAAVPVEGGLASKHRKKRQTALSLRRGEYLADEMWVGPADARPGETP